MRKRMNHNRIQLLLFRQNRLNSTSMHSSRRCTVRFSGCRGCLSRKGVNPGRCLVRGVSAQGRGVCPGEGCLPRQVSPPGCVCPGGVCQGDGCTPSSLWTDSVVVVLTKYIEFNKKAFQ